MKVYPIAEHIGALEKATGYHAQALRAAPTGEIRPPKKGEWYISGAIIEAYQAPSDLTASYRIARIVRVKITKITKIVEIVETIKGV